MVFSLPLETCETKSGQTEDTENGTITYTHKYIGKTGRQRATEGQSGGGRHSG